MSTSTKGAGTKAAICKCGCDRLIIFLRVPLGGDPRKYRLIACYPDGWDGNPWYTVQVRRHPRYKNDMPTWPPPVEAGERLE